MTTALFVFVMSVLLLISVVLSRTSSRIGIPSLVIFIGIGMLAGSEGIGGIPFDNTDVAQFIGMVALVFILFFGGMETNFKSIKPVLAQGLSLATLGVLVTMLVVGLICTLVFDDLTYLEVALLGAIISPTDAAATFNIFKSKGCNLKHNLRPIIELESGTNDPMAYFLTISLITLIQEPDKSIYTLLPNFVKSAVIGAVLGYLFGKVIVWSMRKLKLSMDGLYVVLVYGLALFTYSFIELCDGNGILGIYIAGMLVGNSNFARHSIIEKFFDGTAWIFQIVMFLTLGLLVFPSKVWEVAPEGLLVAVILTFVARPIAVFVSTMFFKFTFKDRLFLSWCGLRGASPIIFATFPAVEGLNGSTLVFNIVFFVSILSVLVQGSTLAWVGEKLGLMIKDDTVDRNVELDLQGNNSAYSLDVVIEKSSYAIGKTISELELKNGVIIMIEVDGECTTPQSDFVIKEGCKLYVTSQTKDDNNYIANVLNYKG